MIGKTITTTMAGGTDLSITVWEDESMEVVTQGEGGLRISFRVHGEQFLDELADLLDNRQNPLAKDREQK